WIAVTATAAFLTAAVLVALRNEIRWRRFVRQLNVQPGIAVTTAHRGWFGPSQITGLRDASAPDAAKNAGAAKIDPAHVQFHWKPFLWHDPGSVVSRFGNRFALPSSAQVNLMNGVLAPSGSVPYDWLERFRREAKFVPG